jgi:hypothetical protein
MARRIARPFRAPLAAGLVVCTALSLAACGGSGSTTASNTATATTAQSASASRTSATRTSGTRTRTQTRTTASAPAPPSHPSGGAYEHALAAYAACMRAQGVDIPPPRRGPNGPLLAKPRGVSTNSKRFALALSHCRNQVRLVLQYATRATSAP